jgi:hypothetical protein
MPGLQPSTERVTLAPVGAADVLFVVDESGSMGGEQAKLAANFQSFIQNLNRFNQERVADQLEPFEFHIAVTTTSVSYNPTLAATCKSNCGGGTAGTLVCCDGSGQPSTRAKTCDNDAQCGATETCTRARRRAAMPGTW